MYIETYISIYISAHIFLQGYIPFYIVIYIYIYKSYILAEIKLLEYCGCLIEVFTTWFVEQRIFIGLNTLNILVFILHIYSAYFHLEYLLKDIYTSNLKFSSISLIISKNNSDYEWAKRLKFLLAVIYKSRRRYSNSSETFTKKVGKNWNKLYGHFRTTLII